MKFRTEIEIAPLGTKIGYENRILALGSCFAEHIAGRLAQAKFRVTANPSGILFKIGRASCRERVSSPV